MYWQTILDEVLNKNSKRQYSFCPNKLKDSKIQTDNKARKNISYKLGEKFPNIYFSKREAECMLKILKQKTAPEIASELRLSTRTIEFYIQNMKHKLNCNLKSQLIDAILNSDFLKNVKLNDDA